MAWLWGVWRPVAGTIPEKVRAAGHRFAPALSQLRSDRASGIAGALESEDFSLLMSLGRQANQAGQRRQAHLCFSRAAALNPNSEKAWLWAAATSDDTDETMSSLEMALAINPASGRARAQLGMKMPTTRGREWSDDTLAGTGLTVAKLLEQGISALDEDREDRAYQLFVAATKADATNENAWFWRAKTALDLNEVIACLERVLEINPNNQKARDSLGWATDRRRTEIKRQQLVHALPPASFASAVPIEMEHSLDPFLLQLASLTYMFLGLLWVVPTTLPILDKSLAALYEEVVFLPKLEMPFLSLAALGILSESVPELNLFYLVPICIALLSFVAMEALWTQRRLVSFFVALVAGASVMATGLFVDGQAASVLLMALSVSAGMSALGGRIRLRHRSRLRSSRQAGPAAHAGGSTLFLRGGQ